MTLTYLPELLPTERWSNDGSGEGGVAFDDPRWSEALERAEVVWGIPDGTGEGLADLLRRAPRLAVGAGPQRRRRRAAPRGVGARARGGAPRHGHHLLRRPRRPAGRVRDLRPARVRQGPPHACSPTSASATGRPIRSRSGSCATARCCWSAWARSAARRPGWRRRSGCTCWRSSATPPAPPRTSTSCTPRASSRRSCTRADAIVVTLPLTDATRGLLDAGTLAAVKPGAVLVNVGRGAGDRRGGARRAPAGRHVRGRRARRLRRGAAAAGQPAVGARQRDREPAQRRARRGRGGAGRRPVHRQPQAPPRTASRCATNSIRRSSIDRPR